MTGRIYLDNAATSWPKPPGVSEAMLNQVDSIGASAGRGSYENAIRATQVVDDCRQRVAGLLNTTSSNVAFTANGTHSLNIAILGYCLPGDHIVTTAIEHNSTLRPLRCLERTRGTTTTVVPCDCYGFVDPADIRAAIRPTTRLIAVSHASNVTGCIQDIESICAIAHEHEVTVLLDAAQTLGHLPIDVVSLGIGMLAASGHKGALGPLGVGLLYIRSELHDAVEPLLHGGTGVWSTDEAMPLEMPHRHEAGNLNVPAIAGLRGALQWLASQSHDDSHQLADELAAKLAQIPTVRVIRASSRPSVAVISITLENCDPPDVVAILDTHFAIEARSGLHCSPLVHRELGTEAGTVRLSLSRFNTHQDIGHVCGAIEKITKSLTARV